MIQSAKYEADGGVTYTSDGGVTSVGAKQLAHHDDLQAWLKAGGVIAPYVAPVRSYTDLRQAAYLDAGFTGEAIAIALIEAQFEGKTAQLQAIQDKRTAIKTKYPKG